MGVELQLNIPFPDFSLLANLQIPANGITALFGSSGAGKTTILRAIAGLDRHPGCAISVADSVWQSSDVFLPSHQRELGYVFQESSLFEHLSVEGNIHFGVKRAKTDIDESYLQSLVDLLALSDLLSRKPETLSGGEKQRVAIARALATKPKLLLMDEPLASLDRARKLEVLPFLERLHQSLDIPIIYVSHYPSEVARLADYLVLLERGTVQAHGPIDDMLTRLDLPLAQDEKAAALIEATVDRHDTEFGLSYLNFSGGRFAIEQQDLSIGDKVRLRLFARDVSLTLSAAQDSSILNIFPARVVDISSHGPSQLLVRLKAGDEFVLARITRKSAEKLSLGTGTDVYVQAKSVALLG